MEVTEKSGQELEKEAWQLLTNYRQRLRAEAEGLCHNPATADDLVIRTLEQAWQKFDTCRSQDNPYGWMKSIMTSLYFNDRLRKVNRNTTPLELEELEKLAPEDNGTLEEVLRKSDGEALHKAVSALDAKYRDAIILHYFQDYSFKEIAGLLRLPIGTVGRRIQIARQILAGKLKAEFRESKPKFLALAALFFSLLSFAAYQAVEAFRGEDEEASVEIMENSESVLEAESQDGRSGAEALDAEAEFNPNNSEEDAMKEVKVIRTTAKVAMAALLTSALGVNASEGVLDPVGLPAGYQQVEYIETPASGTCPYIVTGLNPNLADKIEMTFAVGTSTQQYRSLFNARATTNYAVPLNVGTYFSFRVDHGANAALFSAASALSGFDNVHVLTVDGYNQTANIDGTLSATVGAATGEVAAPIMLFQQGTYSKGAYGSFKNPALATRLYSFKVTGSDGTTVKMNLVPCRETSGSCRVGLYDTVGDGHFYPSENAATFTAGEDVGGGEEPPPAGVITIQIANDPTKIVNPAQPAGSYSVAALEFPLTLTPGDAAIGQMASAHYTCVGYTLATSEDGEEWTEPVQHAETSVTFATKPTVNHRLTWLWEVTGYKVTVTASALEQVTITPAATDGYYPVGTQISLAWSSLVGEQAQFSHWKVNGEAAGSENPLVLTVTEPLAVESRLTDYSALTVLPFDYDLPARYKQVSYLVHDQVNSPAGVVPYIVTDCTPNLRDNIEARFRPAGTTVQCIFSARESSKMASPYSLFYSVGNLRQFRIDRYSAGSGGSQYATGEDYVVSITGTATAAATVNGEPYGGNITFYSGTADAGGPIVFLAAINADNYGNFSSARIYGLKVMTAEGELRFNFIPCVDTQAGNRVGVYETVNGRFYGSANTGVFETGPEVKPDSALLEISSEVEALAAQVSPGVGRYVAKHLTYPLTLTATAEVTVDGERYQSAGCEIQEFTEGNWSILGTNATNTLTLEAAPANDMRYKWLWQHQASRVTVQSGFDAVTVTATPASADGYYAVGTRLTLSCTIADEEVFTFQGWTVDGEFYSDAREIEVTVDAAKRIAPVVVYDYTKMSAKESPTDLPVIGEYDVVVVGGGFAAASAAVAAKAAGASVFLLAPRQNPAEDVISTRRLIGSAEDEGLSHPLIVAAGLGSTANATSPTKCFQAIDAYLIENEVPFFTGTIATGVALDGDGAVAGVIIANRNGRQVVKAKAVIDATEYGAVARRIAAFRPIAPGTTVRFTRRLSQTSTTAPAPEGYEVAAEKHFSSTYKAFALTKSFTFDKFDYLTINRINNEMRDAYHDSTIVDESELAFFVLPDAIVSAAGSVVDWTSAEALSIAVAQPQGVSGLWVVGMAADVAREIAGKLSLPGVGVIFGARVGAAAAESVAGAEFAAELSIGGTSGKYAAVAEKVSRPLGVGNVSEGTVRTLGGAIPVIADVDVLVVGGGTAGAPAGVGAAETGKRVLVAEYLYVLGGTSTDGRIGKYYPSGIATRGFSQRIDEGAGVCTGTGAGNFYWQKSDWLRRTITENHPDAAVVFGAFAEGAILNGTDESGRPIVAGAILVLPDGSRAAVMAKAVVDATGNSDVAYAAGAETMFLDPQMFAMQGSAASPQKLNVSYFNCDVGFLNTPDAGDINSFSLRARRGADASGDWNMSHVISGSRERRRIVGEYVVTPVDELAGRTYPDTIMHGESDFDIHGYTTSPLMMFYSAAQGVKHAADLPYRALIPRGLEGVLVTGLGVSAHRDAMPIIRMQRDVQNQGYAAGLAAAKAAVAGGVRKVAVKELQSELVTAGCLSSRVLTDGEFQPTVSQITTAIEGMDENFHGLEKVLVAPELARAPLEEAYAGASTAEKQAVYGAALMLLGDNRGYEAVTARINALNNWSTSGKDFRGIGNYGRQTSTADAYCYALAAGGDLRAAGYLTHLAYTGLMNGTSVAALSCWRMIVHAANLLHADRLAGMVGVAMDAGSLQVTGKVKDGAVTELSPYLYPASDSGSDPNRNIMDAERNETTRELIGLGVRCLFGDRDAEAGLRRYANDKRTIYAAWARQVLATPRLGEVPGRWVDENTLEINVGSPQNPVTWAGTVAMSNGTLKIATKPSDVINGYKFVLLPEGDFTPEEKFSRSTTPLNNEKRAKTATDFFAQNLTTWDFLSGTEQMRNYLGICIDGSYYSWDNRIGADADHAVYAAFLTQINAGPLKKTIAVDGTAEGYRLKFDYISACGNNGKMNVSLVVSLDGAVIDTLSDGVVDEWRSHIVELGALSAGEHILAFTTTYASTNGTLLDNVMLGTPASPEEQTDYPKNVLSRLRIRMEDGSALNLDGDYTFRIRSFSRDGKRIYGEISGDTGNGRLKVVAPVIVIVR